MRTATVVNEGKAPLGSLGRRRSRLSSTSKANNSSAIVATCSTARRHTL